MKAVAAAALCLSGFPAAANPASAAESTGGRPTVALALGGGAVRGAAHIGVLRVFEKEGIPIDYIAGNSMGAIIGGLYAAGLSLDEIERRLRDKSLLKAYDTIPLVARIILAPILLLPRVVVHPYEGLYRGNKFAKYIQRAVPPERRQIENLKIPFCATACNLLDGKVHRLTRGDIGRVLQASSAIPVYRKPVPLEGMLLVDGGVLENLPTAQARSFNADLVIAVDVDPHLVTLPEKHFRKIGSVGDRTADMILVKLDEPQRRLADLVIQPDVTGISLLVRKSRYVDKAIDAGKTAAAAAVPRLRQLLSEKKEEKLLK